MEMLRGGLVFKSTSCLFDILVRKITQVEQVTFCLLYGPRPAIYAQRRPLRINRYNLCQWKPLLCSGECTAVEASTTNRTNMTAVVHGIYRDIENIVQQSLVYIDERLWAGRTTLSA